MTFNRTITATGNVILNATLVNFSFTYTNGDKPTSVNFNFNLNDSYANGSANSNGIINYNVNNGIIDNSLLLAIEDQCKNILENHETI